MSGISQPTIHGLLAPLTLNALRNGQQDACDKGFAVVRLLEDGDLFAQARASQSSLSACGISREGSSRLGSAGSFQQARPELVGKGLLRGRGSDVRARLLVCEGRELDRLDVHVVPLY